MTIDNLKIIFRRWHAGQSLSEIKRTEAFDRNTLRHYISSFKAAGYLPGCEIRDDQALIALLSGMIPARRRVRKVRQVLDAHRSEIVELVSRKDEPLDPKTAFLVVKEKYDLSVSYETFKLFMKENAIKASGAAPLRIELPPGKETQIDYGLVGTFYDPVTKSNKRVWAFCAKLSCSRLPFVEFVYSQKQESFVESNIRMVEFFGGVTEFLTIDNLKSGVIKPGLYDPLINRAYAEFAEYYGTFINPCRVRKPDDKGKVERQIPQARMLFRRLKEVHPTFTLAELNEAARRWCREEYGMTKHGTTGIAPIELFENIERATLIPLPSERFEVPEWKMGVKVSPDRFFQLQGKYYAMPYEYRNRTLTVRKAAGILRVFDTDYSLIREYTITGKSRSWLPGDFPEDKEVLMAGEYPQWLLRQARKYGPTTEKLIESILKPHAYLNARRARGILGAIEKYRSHPFLQEVCGKAIKGEVRTPGQIAAMLESLSHQQHFDFIIPRSGLGEAMTRDAREYFN